MQIILADSEKCTSALPVADQTNRKRLKWRFKRSGTITSWYSSHPLLHVDVQMSERLNILHFLFLQSLQFLDEMSDMTRNQINDTFLFQKRVKVKVVGEVSEK